MMEVENFSKIYDRRNPPAVNNISFKVNNGEILGFAGLNGAGKTTTIRVVSGTLLPTSGLIQIDGKNIISQKIDASKGIGWMPEYPNFESEARPVPLLRYYAGFYGMKGKEATDHVVELLKEVGLDSYTGKKLKTYSQGMKKRFSLASAMVSNPQNFLLDESLNGLDPEGIDFVRKLMLKFKKAGKAVLLSSHILSELENLADRIMIIHKGAILETLSKEKMRSMGKPVIRLEIMKHDDKSMKIMEQYGKVTMDGDRATLTDLTSGMDSAADLNAELSKEGYRVLQFNVSGQSLEEHFFELIGGAK